MTKAVVFSLFALGFFSLSFSAVGYDQNVTADLSLEGYTVYAGNGATLSKRRVVGNLGLGAWNILPDEKDPYYKGPRLSMDISLRIAGDMGIVKNESTPNSTLSYVPGLDPLSLALMSAYLDAVGFWHNTLDLRLGRQLRLDTLGFFAFDGVDIRIRLPIGVELSSYVGLEVRGGQLFGYDNFELDGTDRGRREKMSKERYPDREESKTRPVAGFELGIAPWKWLDAGVGFRVTGIAGNNGNMADERVGGRIHIDADKVQMSGRAVYNTMINNVSDAEAEIGVLPSEPLGFFVEYYRYKPTFDADSIFNVFNTTAQHDLGGRVDLRINKSVDLSSWAFARFADESGGISGDEENALIAGVGGGIGANYRTIERALSGRFSVVSELGERRVGAELGGGHGFLNNHRLWLSFRMSYWHIEDDFSEFFKGDVVGYVLSGLFKLTHQLSFLGEFEHFAGDGRPSRLTAFAFLKMDLWR